jgi:hypothetical protein
MVHLMFLTLALDVKKGKRMQKLLPIIITVALQPAIPCAGIGYADVAQVGLDMALDRQGNAYFTGVVNPEPNSPDYHLTAKYDSNGMKLWERGSAGPKNLWGMTTAVTADKYGNAYVTGHFMLRKRTDDFDDTVFGYMTVKYDPKGNKLWDALYSESGRMLIQANHIACDNRGNVCIAVTSHESEFSSDPNEKELSDDYIDSIPSSDIILIKYDPNGKQTWLHRHTNSRPHDYNPTAICFDSKGNLFCSASLVTENAEGDLTSESIAVKYAPDGKQIWLAKYSEESFRTYSPDAMTIDNTGNVYVAGVSTRIFEESQPNMLVTKYDKNGNLTWTAIQKLNKGMFVHTAAMTVDCDGSICITGNVSPMTTGTGYPPRDTIEKMKMSQIVTLKYDTNGKQKWLTRYKGTPNEAIFSRYLLTDDSANIYIVGTGAFVIKYNSMGLEKWKKQFNYASELSKYLSTIQLQ